MKSCRRYASDCQASIGDNAEIVENTVRYSPVTKGWRMILRVKVKDPENHGYARCAGQYRPTSRR